MEPHRRSVYKSTCTVPSVLHNRRFGQRLVQERDPTIWINVVQRLASMPCHPHRSRRSPCYGCTLSSLCCLLRARVLLKGPWLIFVDLYPDVLTTNLLNTYSIPFLKFHGFPTSKSQSNSFRHAGTFQNWFLDVMDVLVPKLLK